jgi:hypothetical protein
MVGGSGFVYVAPIFFASALLLFLAGIGKLAAPANAARALSAARLPNDRPFVRAFAAYELGLGTACIAIPTRPVAAALAITYAAFAVFLIRLMKIEDPVAGCGCVGGKKETPPSRVHVILNLVAAASSVGALAFSPTSVADLVGDVPVAGVGFIIGTITIAYLAYVMALHLPSVASRKRANADQMNQPLRAPMFFVERIVD